MILMCPKVSMAAAWPRGAWRLLGSRLAPWGAGLLLVFGGVPGVCLARGWRLGELVSSWFSGRGHRASLELHSQLRGIYSVVKSRS